MKSKEYLFRLQVFQQTISTLYTYPLRIYKNNCQKNFTDELEKNGDAIKLHKVLSPNQKYNANQLILHLKNYISNNPNVNSDKIFTILKPYSKNLSNYIWEIHSGNSLSFTHDIKEDERIKIYLMIYDLYTKKYIDQHFTKPYNGNCFIGMKNIFIKLNEEYTICIGRLFTKEEDINLIIKNVINNFNFNYMNIFELTKSAKKRRAVDNLYLDNSITNIRDAFDLFLKVIKQLPNNISKEEIENVSVFIYRIIRKKQLPANICTARLQLTFNNNLLTIKSNIDKNHQYDEYQQYYINRFETNKDLFRSEYTSRAKNYLNKKYSGLRHDNYEPIDELLKRICYRLNADGGCYIRYNISDQKLEAKSNFGKSNYIEGIENFIKAINNNKDEVEKSRVLKVIKNYFNNEYQHDINKLIIRNLDSKDLLQPIDNQPILSNIAIPITFRHKLLGVLLIDSFRKNNYTEDDINIILSLSDALSVQIFDQIVEKNLFKIIENVPNQAELTEENTLDDRFTNLVKSINKIFFSYGVAIWNYDGNEFTLSATTLKIPKNEQQKKIKKNTDNLIWEIFNDNRIKLYNIKNGSDGFNCCNPKKYDPRINCIEIYPIKGLDKNIVGALSIYNATKDDYRAIDEQSLKSVVKHIEIFFNIIKTFKDQKELVHKNALHDISSKLNMIKDKTSQLKNIILEDFKELNHQARH